MQIQKITLKELRRRGEIDLIGGTMEIPWQPHANSPTRTFRGKIEHLHWHPDCNIRRITVGQLTVWHEALGIWNEYINDPFFLDFTWHPWCIDCIGVYEIENAELALILENSAYISFFPIGIDPYPSPINYQRYCDMHRILACGNATTLEIPDWT